MTEHLIDSTGHLPPVELVTSLFAQAYDRIKSITEGNVAQGNRTRFLTFRK